ncbi:MAG: aspartate carbamoyltransferase [Opitutales bacterium]
MNRPIGPNQSQRYTKPPEDSKSLNPEPVPLFKDKEINEQVLLSLHRQSVVSANDFTREQIVELAKFAASLETLEISKAHPLDGKIVITAFFEASTRTRVSFESAVLRLDGKIISIPEGSTTGVKKGESLEDIGEMFNAYGDLVIMRHTQTNAIERIRQGLRLPVINAGNGTGEHPTQALADWYALIKWRPELIDPGADLNLNLAILGTPGSMRAVKSFLLMAINFKEHINSVTFISEMADPLGAEIKKAITDAGIDYTVSNDMGKHLPEMDVIYMNSIVCIGENYTAMDASYKLNRDSPLKEGAVILHPLARLDELDRSLDQTPHNLYFSQAHGAVFIRQALLTCILGRLNAMPREVPLAP